MEINIFSQKELPAVFSVLRTALNPGELNLEEKSFLETYSKITGYKMHPEPTIINPESVSLEDPHKAKRLIQLCAMAVLLSRPVRKESVAFVEVLARHLRISDPVIGVLSALAIKNVLKARLTTIRRVFRMIIGESYRVEGPMGIVRFFAAIFGRLSVNNDKLWKYKRLGLLSEGTLGREYWKHITELGFSFPGERGGIPDPISYHDVSHVLNDYDTTPRGEIQQGSFQGGSRREGGFGFIQFVILQFHQGIRITPIAKAEVGNFDPTEVLWAIHRGALFKEDVTQGWNYWKLMSLPLEEARAQMGLIPKI